MEWMGVVLRRYIDFLKCFLYLFLFFLVIYGEKNRIEVEGVHYIETQCGQHMC